MIFSKSLILRLICKKVSLLFIRNSIIKLKYPNKKDCGTEPQPLNKRITAVDIMLSVFQPD